MSLKTALKNRRSFQRAFLLLLTALLLLSLFPVRSAALTAEAFRADSESYTDASLAPVPSRSTWNYTAYTLSYNGRELSSRALLINGEIYIPMRAFSEALGAKVSYNSSSRTLTVSASGLYITVSDGSYVAYANERPLFSRHNSVIMSDGRMYVPAPTVMKAFGLSHSLSSGKVEVKGTYKPLTHASLFYREDEVLWLSRIISAESRGEPLLGQIAVGSVVMNRVASRDYPNTIYGVIFDRKYGVQFSPVLDGSIYNTPTYNCILAAKICLEGVRIGNGALFFLRPEASSSLWIPATRPYLFSVGNHDFYA